MPTVTIRDTGDLKRLNKQLRQVADGKELGRELSAGLRGVARPIAQRIKAAYLAAPSRGLPKTRSRAQQPSLRVLLSTSVKVEVRRSGRLAGARIRADGRRMPSGMKSLPRLWEGPAYFGWSGRWRHPIFPDAGSRHRFTDRTRTQVTEASWTQQPSPETFYRTVEPDIDNASRAIDRVLDKTERKLERR